MYGELKPSDILGIINPVHLIGEKIYTVFSRERNIRKIIYDFKSILNADKLADAVNLFPQLKEKHPELTKKNIFEANSRTLAREIESAGVTLMILTSEFILDLLVYLDETNRVYDGIEKLMLCICDQSIKVYFVAEEAPIRISDDNFKKSLYEDILDRILSFLNQRNNVTVFRVYAVFGEGDHLDETLPKTTEKKIDLNNATLSDEVALFLQLHMCESNKEIRIPSTKDLKWALDIKCHQTNCSFKLIYQLRPEDYFFNKLVCKERIALGEELSDSIPMDVADEIDFVTPVPNTGTYYAMGLAKEMCKPYIQAIIKTSFSERSFQIADPDTRKKFLWSKIRPIKELIKGKKIAVVDEAIFTGSTLKVVCEMLHECNVKKIYLCIPTPKCRHHCSYLVYPERDMLLEYLSESTLTEYFDVEGIFFQDDKKFEKELSSIAEGLCMECFLGGKQEDDE